jgi:membrane-associated phospholipid phosphatase
MPWITNIALKQEWGSAWQSARFRRRILMALFFAISIASLFPVFFRTIEKRDGVVLNDWILNQLPAHDVSLPLTLVVWVMTALIVFRCIQSPNMLMIFLWSYVIVSLVRILTISLVALDAPVNLIGLADPLSNAFYGSKFVTKDLFFSGHTSTLFLMALCLQNRTEKILGFIATAIVGFLLLVQHVHYSMDVLAAPVFTWFVYKLTKRFLARGEDGDQNASANQNASAS